MALEEKTIEDIRTKTTEDINPKTGKKYTSDELSSQIPAKEASEAKRLARQAAARAEAGYQEYGGYRGEMGEQRRQQKMLTGEGRAALEAQQAVGRRDIGRATSAGLGQAAAAGAFGGGATAAQLGQVAQERGMTQARFGAESQLGIEDYRQKAAQEAARQLMAETGMLEAETEMGQVAAVQGVEAETFARGVGTEAERSKQANLEARKNIAQIKKDNKGGSIFEPDTEENAAAAIRALGDAETDPVAKKLYYDEAARIDKEGDFAF